MKGTTMNFTNSVVIPLALGLVCAGVVWAALAGKNLPLISSPKAALGVLLVVGLAMCAPGIGQVSASGRWASPVAILGYVLGAAILLVIVAGLVDFKLPLVQSASQAVLAVAVLMAAKFAIGTASYFFHWL
jgi:hypothetical protein